ncbi:Zinc-binding dehydrogenase [Phytophthora infestans]|uniref:Zinc-binding dehydrogenase n=1 Tax=Phytophthora infestans TaxID=4787 RepID=A0A8S9TZ70_PHYIN|nr:Zinc-binding dehydrogenase [Phytophthora infestans]
MPEPTKEAELGAKLIGLVSSDDKSAETLRVITEYIESGKAMPMIDTVYPLEKTLDAYAKLKSVTHKKSSWFKCNLSVLAWSQTSLKAKV